MSCNPNHLLIELGVSRRKEGREIMDKKLSKVCWFPSLWIYSGWMPIVSKSNLSWAISSWERKGQ